MQDSELQQYIGQWAESTFPEHTDQSIVKHIAREVVELCQASGVEEREILLNVLQMSAKLDYSLKRRYPAEEAADIVILLMTLGHRQGWDLMQQVRLKMRVNEARQWGPPDNLGIREHIDGQG